MKTVFAWFLVIAFQLIACSSTPDPAPNLPPLPKPPVTNPDGNAPSIAQVDDAVREFMNKHNVPGAAVAITKNGKLVYKKGYGFADREASAYVNDSSLFRIASISKPVTAIAIMKLVEEGKLTLNARVFGEGAILGTEYGTQPYGNALTAITVQHLLQHTAGGWANDNQDPMFTNPTLTAQELISWTLTNRPLTNTPGTSFAYSNFGYSILGRVIEKVTGKTYEAYVKTDILQPLGITKMRLGGNTLADRVTNEVKYYGQQGGDPYIYNIMRMDAHGGWIASATDLVRLLVHADGFASKPDILSAQTIRTMTTAPPNNSNYAAGWSVNASDNWWHTGSLPGTYTMLARTSGGYNWAILTNTRTTDSSFGADLDQVIWKAVNNPSTPWPDVDLF